MIDECLICSRKFNSASSRAAHSGQVHTESERREAHISEIQRLYGEIGRTPTSNDMDSKGQFSASSFENHFGSWNSALHAAGYSSRTQRNIPEHELLIELKRLADECGWPPTARQMDEKGKFNSRTYCTRFGTWYEALEKAGLDTQDRHYGEFETDDLLSEIIRLARESGGPPTADEMDKVGRFGTTVYLDRFGTWNDALRAAGVGIGRRRSVPLADLIESIARLAGELGRTPTSADMRESGDFGVKTYQRRFRSWNSALEAAGFSPIKKMNVSRDDLLDELQWLEDKVDRVPMVDDLRVHGKYSTHPFRREFGSWAGALEAVGLKPVRSAPGTSDHWHIYGPGWTDTVKKGVRDRDGRVCVDCGMDEETHRSRYGQVHDVHHICSAIESTNPAVYNASRNLVTLCRGCHRERETRMQEQRGTVTAESEYEKLRLPSGDDDTISACPPAHIVLGIKPDADARTVRDAYADRIKAAHPDHGGSRGKVERVKVAKEAMLNG